MEAENFSETLVNTQDTMRFLQSEKNQSRYSVF
jgi:hypothetical protein